jgi:hypothetical protein
MPDPFRKLHHLDLTTLPDPSKWAADLHAPDEWAEALAQPFDDVPGFDAQIDPEVDTTIRLNGDRSYTRTPSRRLFHDYRANPDAYKHLDHLPGPGESLHGVISGKYALFEIIPALIEKTGRKIDDLTIATLSFNKANAADLLGLLDDGHVRRVGLLISYYFKSTSRPIYDTLVPQLRERGQRVLAMRTHAKIILAKLDDGTCYVAESSANLRSSVNVEQFVLTRCPDLYRFHFDWLEGELLHGTELGKDADQSKDTDRPPAAA